MLLACSLLYLSKILIYLVVKDEQHCIRQSADLDVIFASRKREPWSYNLHIWSKVWLRVAVVEVNIGLNLARAQLGGRVPDACDYIRKVFSSYAFDRDTFSLG